MAVFCRSCMNSASLKYVELGSIMTKQISYLDYFNQCTELNAEIGDGLPSILCTNCTNLLKSVYDFVCIAKKADMMFREVTTDALALKLSQQTIVKEEIIEEPNLEEINIDTDRFAIKHYEKNKEIPISDDMSDEYNNQIVDSEKGIVNSGNFEMDFSANATLEDPFANTNVPENQTEKFTEKCKAEPEDFDEVEGREHMLVNREDKLEIELTCFAEPLEENELRGKKILKRKRTTIPNKNRSSEYECAYCSEKFRVLSRLTNHEISVHSSEQDNPRHECTICFKKHFCYGKLQQHIKQVHFAKKAAQCYICGKTFKNSSLLSTHMKLHRDLQHKCSICNKAYPRGIDLKRHMVSHTGETPYACDICDKRYTTTAGLTLHMRKHKDLNEKGVRGEKSKFINENVAESNSGSDISSKNDKKCVIPIDFSDKKGSNLETTNSQFETDTVKCRHCEEFFELKELPKHLRCVHPDKYRIKLETKDTSLPSDNSFEENENCFCQHCDIHFIRAVDMHDHVRAMHNDKLGDKSLEIDSVYSKSTLKHDKSTKLSITEYTCAYCAQKFNVLRKLTNHEISVHSSEQDNPRNECSICYKKYFSFIKLQRHKQFHLPRKSTQCNVCGKTFKNTSYLSAHKRLHRELQYKCSVCNKEYPREIDLKRHMVSHTGETPYVCEICGKSYTTTAGLTQHLRKHKGLKQKCTFCEEEFKDYGSLLRHRYRNHTGMPYQCELCANLGFLERKSFAEHMVKKHERHLTDTELNENYTKNTGRIKMSRNKPYTEI